MARQNPNHQITRAARALGNKNKAAVTRLLLLNGPLLYITYGWFRFTFNHLNPCEYVQVINHPLKP